VTLQTSLTGEVAGIVARVPGSFIAKEQVYRGQTSFPRHEHEFSSLFVILDGVVREESGNENLDCRSGAIGFVPAGEAHASRFGATPVHGLTVILDESWLTRAGVDRAERASAGRRRVGYAPAGRTAVPAMRLNTALRRPDVGAGLATEELLLDLLAAALPDDAAESHARRDARDRGWITRVTELLTERCADPISLSEVARCAGRNHAHAARAFRAATGSSMTEHMQTARITRACALLRTTRASIVDVALRVGFFDQAHFTRVFRRVMGDTPARYRASFR